MRLFLGAKFLVGYMLILCFPVCAVAQVTPVNPDVLIANPAADDDFLLPSYWATPSAAPAAPNAMQAPTDVDILTAIFGTAGSMQSLPEVGSGVTPLTDPSAQMTKRTFYPRSMLDREDGQKPEDEVAEEDRGPLLTPLPPLEPEAEPDIPPKKVTVIQSGYVNQLLRQSLQPQNGSTVPKEVRIKFYPDDVQLSLQNLRWIKLFVNHVLPDPRLVFAVRLSDKNWPLQRSRLAMILQVAMEAGLTAHQIRVYSSDRDENSIILSYAHNDTLTQIRPFQGRTKLKQKHKTLSW